MRNAFILLAAAVLTFGVSLNFGGSRQAAILGLAQALGEDKIEVSMPPEAVGFNGKLSGQVAKPVSNGWFTIKVVKVLSLSSSNKSKLKAKALTAVWKDKYVAVRGVKDMPQLKVGDMVIVTAYQFEMHIRSTKVTKPPAPKPSGDSAAQKP
jgi:hypothetical protein